MTLKKKKLLEISQMIFMRSSKVPIHHHVVVCDIVKEFQAYERRKKSSYDFIPHIVNLWIQRNERSTERAVKKEIPNFFVCVKKILCNIIKRERIMERKWAEIEMFLHVQGFFYEIFVSLFEMRKRRYALSSLPWGRMKKTEARKSISLSTIRGIIWN